MDIIRIYGLLDPDTKEVRYIGKTGRELKHRHREHVTDLKDNSHKVKWIKKLKTSNKLPIIELIEECNELNWSEREKYWITQFTNLTNSTDGGEDGKHTKETIDKLRLLNKGKNNPCYGKVWSEEERKKLSDARKKVILTEDWKDNISKTLGFNCTIDGVEYNSIKKASITLSLTHRTIKKRIDSEEYPTYFFNNQ
jgi:group I intron endonuclease